MWSARRTYDIESAESARTATEVSVVRFQDLASGKPAPSSVRSFLRLVGGGAEGGVQESRISQIEERKH